MIQCKDCEFYEIGPDGRKTFKCDPFTNIKEAECIAKWQLIRLDMLVASYQGMLKLQEKLAPLRISSLNICRKKSRIWTSPTAGKSTKRRKKKIPDKPAKSGVAFEKTKILVNFAIKQFHKPS